MNVLYKIYKIHAKFTKRARYNEIHFLTTLKGSLATRKSPPRITVGLQKDLAYFIILIKNINSVNIQTYFAYGMIFLSARDRSQKREGIWALWTAMHLKQKERFVCGNVL